MFETKALSEHDGLVMGARRRRKRVTDKRRATYSKLGRQERYSQLDHVDLLAPGGGLGMAWYDIPTSAVVHKLRNNRRIPSDLSAPAKIIIQKRETVNLSVIFLCIKERKHLLSD
jgi:hypothetical protein